MTNPPQDRLDRIEKILDDIATQQAANTSAIAQLAENTNRVLARSAILDDVLLKLRESSEQHQRNFVTLPSLLLVERRDLPDCSAIYFVTRHTSSLGDGSVTGRDGSVTGELFYPSQLENLIGQNLQPLEDTSVTGVTGKTEITRWRRKYFLFPRISQLKKIALKIFFIDGCNHPISVLSY